MNSKVHSDCTYQVASIEVGELRLRELDIRLPRLVRLMRSFPQAPHPSVVAHMKKRQQFGSTVNCGSEYELYGNYLAAKRPTHKHVNE